MEQEYKRTASGVSKEEIAAARQRITEKKEQLKQGNNYRDKYNALPAPAQKAIRELMDALLKCDREPIVNHGTICQSRLETAVMHVGICTSEIKERYVKQ